MAGTLWEYLRVNAYGSTRKYMRRQEEPSAKEVFDRARAEWEAVLNERGIEGWELVSEQVYSEDRVGHAYLSFSGTMKRPFNFEPDQEQVQALRDHLQRAAAEAIMDLKKRGEL